MHRYKWSCSYQFYLSCFSHVFYPSVPSSSKKDFGSCSQGLFKGTVTDADCKQTVPEQQQWDVLMGALASHFQSICRSHSNGSTTVRISDLVSKKGGLPFLHFICLWELKCSVLVSDFFLPIHLALLSFLTTVIRKLLSQATTIFTNSLTPSLPWKVPQNLSNDLGFPTLLLYMFTNRSAWTDFRNNYIKDKGGRMSQGWRDSLGIVESFI